MGEYEHDLIPSSSRSSNETPRERFGLRNTLELGRVPTPEMEKSVNKTKSLYPNSRHHLDRTTVIKPGSARQEKRSLKKPKSRVRPNSAGARPVVKSSEEHFGSTQFPSTIVQAEGRKSKKESSKPVYPAAKVDSWIVKSPRSNANTQYTKSVTKSFGRPTGDTHELILNSSAASHSGSPSGAATSPEPFSKAVMEKHHQQPANKN